MSNSFFAVLALCILSSTTQAQIKYFTKSGKINFSSKSPLEDIEGKNKSVTSVLDTQSGSFQFIALIKGFEFENEEMQDHFNSDYLESDRYPKAEFKGQIINNPSINYGKPGNYPAQVKGQLTIHGVTREVQANGTIVVQANQVLASSTFNMQVADYNIKIPSIVKDKIAKTVSIVVDTKLDPLK